MYIYEMHQHTCEASACGRESVEAVVRSLKKQGFAGVVLTDHFYHGNSRISRDLPWEDFVKPYVEAYEKAKAVGQELDFDVLFGLEEGVGKGKEVLLYGITPEFVYAHPELRNADLRLISELVRVEGGVVVQAHPFRAREYIIDPLEELPAELLDGVETYNVHNSPEENAMACAFAEKHSLLPTAGSDSHDSGEGARMGIACENRIPDEKALAQILKSGAYTLYLP